MVYYGDLNFEIKAEGPHTRSGAAASCVHAIIPYNINMIIFKSTCSEHVSDHCSFFCIGNWSDSFYRENVSAQFKKDLKK